MALNVWVSQLGWSATAKQPSPITFLDHPSGTATARAGFSFSSASNSKNAKNVGMGMGTGGLSGRSDGIGNGRVHTVTRSGLDTAGATVGQVTEVNKDTFWPIVNAAAAADKIVVLDMYTQWCGPCKVMAPKFEQLSEKYLDAVFLKLDCNQENKVLAKELGIRVVPTFKILKDAKVVKEVTGAKFDDLVLAIEKVAKVELNLEESFSVHAGIAHTRWATHGEPSPRNSHPQTSGPANEFLVAHNGIITNYEVLKETLVRHGFTFESETDTEVIPKLAKFVFDKANEEGDQAVTFSEVVLEVMRHLEGAYALIFKSSHYPNELIACKRGSPLLLGVKELTENMCNGSAFEDNKFLSKNGHPRELFLSSDANAVVEHTKKVLVIEDDEVVHLKDGGVSILKFENDKGKHGRAFSRPASVQRALSVLEMEVEQINKGHYEHYMQKEIHEQPESLTTTMRGRLILGGSSKSKTVLLGGLKDHLKTIRRSRRIVFIGCGTSYNAALAARPILEELSGVPVTMEIASDLLDRQGPIYREDTAVFVSQSGETADTLHALQYALDNGALCVGITNTVGSAIARNTHCGVHINAGAEIGVASTKAYTSQIVVMAMLALVIGGDTISNQARREAIIDGLYDLPNKVRDVLKLDQEMKDLAKLLIAEQSLLVFGRGYNYATALEGALKVKEVALMHSEGILAGEMKHGPLALVDENLPTVVIATRDACFIKQRSVIQQLHARKGRLVVMCSKGDAAAVCPGESCRVIEVPQVEDCLQPVINIIPLQLLAYHLTVLRGFNVDQPRNLAKSVTTQ